MLAIAVTITTVSVVQLQTDFELRQNEKRVAAKLIYKYLKSISNDKRILWLTSLSSQHLSIESDYFTFDQAVQRQFDLDELRIDAVWVIDDNYKQRYSSGVEANEQVIEVAKNVFENQTTEDLIYCQMQSKDCYHIVAMPVLVGGNKLEVVISRANLSDLLFTFLKLNENTRLAIINVALNKEPQLTTLGSMNILTMTNGEKTKQIIDSIPIDTTLTELHQSVSSQVGSEYFSSSVFELQPNRNDGNYLLLIEDTTLYRQTTKRYQYYIVMIATVLFVLISIVVLLVSRRSSKRLLMLAADLPLLAEKRFEEFKQRKLPSFQLAEDELDVLADSASSLADQLENLHVKIEQNTRELENIAMYDLLTGLPNRNMLNFQLKKSLSSLSRPVDKVAVLFLDLDDFKKVNDSHGHSMGDLLLEEAARRLRTSIRETDIACRFGGDEFVIVLPNINNWDDVEIVANKLLQSFKEPVVVNEHRFYVSTSIGGAISIDNVVNAEDLVRNADMAMYEAKESGGNCYRIYDAGMYKRIAEKVLLESEVREAIAHEQFTLSLQPQIEIATGKLFGFEALIRWNHPTRGLVYPDEFIPILENSKHMIELGYWVIRHSIKLLSQLNDAGYSGLHIAINLSADQFVDPHLSEYLMTQLHEFNVPAHYVELELTERTLVEDIENTLATMHSLKALGFTFSIDDFGTGYSSLSYLKKMPVDCIKIDKCFVSGMLDNQADMQIVSSTIAMVRNLGMKVTAEGVETRAQLRLLKAEHCDLVQGYLFSKPISENSLLEKLNLLVDKGLWIDAAETGYYSL